MVTVTSLASGSSGNALLVRCEQGALLVDCGLAQRTIEQALRRNGLHPRDLSAIALTHEHGDHAHSAGSLARRYDLPLICNHATRVALGEQLRHVRVLDMPTGGELEIGPFGLHSFRLAHDAAEPVGYRVRCEGIGIGIAVDLGSWDEHLVEELRASDLLIIEANHDRERLWAAPYPWGTRHRIYGPLGHLDNIAAGELLARVAADGRRRHVWLAHLSYETNSAELALRSVRAVLTLAGVSCLELAAAPARAMISWTSDHTWQQQHLL